MVVGWRSQGRLCVTERRRNVSNKPFSVEPACLGPSIFVTVGTFCALSVCLFVLVYILESRKEARHWSEPRRQRLKSRAKKNIASAFEGELRNPGLRQRCSGEVLARVLVRTRLEEDSSLRYGTWFTLPSKRSSSTACCSFARRHVNGRQREQ